MPQPSNIRKRQASRVDTGGGNMKAGSAGRVGKSLHSFLLLSRTSEKNCGCKTYR